MKVHNLSIDSNQRDLSVYPKSNNYVITLENPIYDVEEIRLISARIPTPQVPSPNSLILRLSSGSDELNQSVYVGRPHDGLQKGTPHYTGHILLNGTTNITFNGSDDPLVHRFHSGPQKMIKNLGIEFLYMNNGVLTTYEVGNTDHVLKFEIKCSTDKLEGLTKVPIEEVVEKPISIPEVVENVYRWKKEYTYITVIVFIGLILLLLMKRQPKRYQPPISE
jgi:hypothetical protein